MISFTASEPIKEELPKPKVGRLAGVQRQSRRDINMDTPLLLCHTFSCLRNTLPFCRDIRPNSLLWCCGNGPIRTTTVEIGVKRKVIPPKFLVLKNVKGNRTLLGAVTPFRFLSSAGIVLDPQKGGWYFSGTPHQQFGFIEYLPNIKSLMCKGPMEYIKLNVITVLDSCPLTRIDDLQHDAKPTTLSSIDLKACYHQVKSPFI
ncbi:hypothetical protein CEXT_279371 [Caerostris extrusa]|uniref:Uncharacterized protein n=1 Tax=Caerostris extrusa TaxID=172846 RepID=A0AAV4XF33_CAEEX|nr:hypothetical protein CEXT_279371 [Caerostris extrusa]